MSSVISLSCFGGCGGVGGWGREGAGGRGGVRADEELKSGPVSGTTCF